MILAELITVARDRIDDKVVEYFVQDDELARLLSEAEREATIRARLIYDLFEIELAQGRGEFVLPEKVFAVDSVDFSRKGGWKNPVNLTGMDTVSEHGLNRGKREGTPHFAVHVPTARKVRLFPAASLPGQVHLAGYRLPRYDLEQDDDEPEIEAQHHENLVAWAAYRVLSQKDSELYDPGLAGEQLNEFERNFGRRETAQVMQRHAERRRVTTRYGGIR